MSTDTVFPESLQDISRNIEALNDISRELIDVIEEQIDAVISADTDKVEELTETHTDLEGRFRKNEKAFVEKLKGLLAPASEDRGKIKLSYLKELFPAASASIDQWRKRLDVNTRELKKKHDQLVRLMEFALERNTAMMHSIYSLYNQKNTHYSPNGGKEDISSGMAINQEA